MEWIGTLIGTIRSSEIMKLSFSFIVVLHYKRLYCIALWVVNIVFMSKNGNMHTCSVLLNKANLTIVLKRGIIDTAVS